MIFGARGQVGHELMNAQDAAIGFDRAAVDISDESAVSRALRDHPPAALINAAAYTAVDKAETELDAAFRVNREGAAVLARAADQAGVPLVHISTDYVFDGTKRTPYQEDDPVAPLGVYGLSKAEGEIAVRALCPRHLILRTSWVYSARGSNFVLTMLRLGSEHPELRIVDDQIGCPTAAGDIARTILAILAVAGRGDFDAWGTYHYRGAEVMSWYRFAEVIFGMAAARGLKVPRILSVGTADYPTLARRPAYSVLATEKLQATFGIDPRPVRENLEECFRKLFRKCPNK